MVIADAVIVRECKNCHERTYHTIYYTDNKYTKIEKYQCLGCFYVEIR